MVHPNVISIYDIGEFEEDGVKKPFFVMPLLPGVTLDKLIKDGSPRLSVAGVMDDHRSGLRADCTPRMSRAWCIATSSRATSS